MAGRRKTCAAALLLLALWLMFSGCSRFASVNDLLVPPRLSAENARLRTAFEHAYGKDVQYRSAVSGEYLSSFLIEDLDADGEQEALVFYTPNALDTTLHVALMDKTDAGWTALQSLELRAADIESLQLSDMDRDGETEILLRSGVVENNCTLSILTCGIEPLGLTKLFENNCTALLQADLDDDGQTQFVTIDLIPDAGSTSPQARVLQKTQSGIVVRDNHYLDAQAVSYRDILMQRTDSGCVLYADALCADGGMMTEVIVWDRASASMSTPLLDRRTRSNTQTFRPSRIVCRDLDGDGVPEIPCGASPLVTRRNSGDDDNKQPNVTQWCTFRDGSLQPVCRSLVREDGKCMFVIPDDWSGQFSVATDTDPDRWDFYQIDPRTHAQTGYLFSVIFTTETQWEQNKDSDFVDYSPLVTAGEDMLLVYGVNTESSLVPDTQILRDAFVMLQ